MEIQEIFYSENCWNSIFTVFQTSLAQFLLRQLPKTEHKDF